MPSLAKYYSLSVSYLFWRFEFQSLPARALHPNQPEPHVFSCKNIFRSGRFFVDGFFSGEKLLIFKTRSIISGAKPWPLLEKNVPFNRVLMYRGSSDRRTVGRAKDARKKFVFGGGYNSGEFRNVLLRERKGVWKIVFIQNFSKFHPKRSRIVREISRFAGVPYNNPSPPPREYAAGE